MSRLTGRLRRSPSPRAQAICAARNAVRAQRAVIRAQLQILEFQRALYTAVQDSPVITDGSDGTANVH